MALSTLAVLLIVAGVVGFVFLIGVGIFVLRRLGFLSEIPPDATIILNLKPNAAGGHAVGLKASKSEVKVDSREGFKFFPLDYDADLEEATRSFPVVVNKNKVLRFSKGELSDFRNIEIVLPNSVVDLPDRFQGTSLGRALFQVVEEQNLIDELRKTVELGNRTKAEILEAVQDNRYLELYMEKIKSVVVEAATTNLVESQARVPPAMGELRIT